MPAPCPGRAPELERWELPGGHAASTEAIQSSIAHRLAGLPGDSEGRRALRSDALMLQLPDSASAAQVEAAVVAVVRDMLPALGYAIDKEAQVGVRSMRVGLTIVRPS